MAYYYIYIFYFYPNRVQDIRRDWIYESILLKDDDGRVFKPPSNIPAYAPEFFCDLPITANPREFQRIFRRIIPSISKTLMKLNFSHNGKNIFQITTSKGPKDINTCSFADLYDSLLYKRKSPPHPWKQKWESEENIDASDWVTVWENIHHPSLSQNVRVVLRN